MHLLNRAITPFGHERKKFASSGYEARLGRRIAIHTESVARDVTAERFQEQWFGWKAGRGYTPCAQAAWALLIESAVRAKNRMRQQFTIAFI